MSKKYDIEVPEALKQIFQHNQAKYLKKDSPVCYLYLYNTIMSLLDYEDNKDYLKNKLGKEYEKVMDDIDSFQKEYSMIESLNMLCSKRAKKQQNWGNSIFLVLREIESTSPLIRKNVVRVYCMLVLRTYLKDIPITSEGAYEGMSPEVDDVDQELEDEEEGEI